MSKIPVIAIFDVGKTNKKLFLIDEGYHIVAEYAQKVEEIADEDGFACDDLRKLRSLFADFLQQVSQLADYDLKGVNVSAYGASFVYVDDNGEPVFPLYNYLKPLDETLKQKFYNDYGGEEQISVSAASPVLGNLNSGMQVYRLKYEKPETFAKVKYAIHLPQYLAYLVSGKPVSDLTSIGCHTNLWNFNTRAYQPWIENEGMTDILPPIAPSSASIATEIGGHVVQCGVGLHDSSAALIPYLAIEKEPFILLSTGTWCIALNPFNDSPLTPDQLAHDCLCYLTYQGKPVKASRLFAGNFHELEAKRIAAHFGVPENFFKEVGLDIAVLEVLETAYDNPSVEQLDDLSQSPFAHRSLEGFLNAEVAYHQLIRDMIAQQVHALGFVLAGSNEVKKLFVDGGFSNNSIFMHLLAREYPEMEVYASQVAQASAIGAALAIHDAWNTQSVPPDILKLTKYNLTN